VDDSLDGINVLFVPIRAKIFWIKRILEPGIRVRILVAAREIVNGVGLIIPYRVTCVFANRIERVVNAKNTPLDANPILRVEQYLPKTVKCRTPG
jgi:hypothetical protein